MGRKSILRVLAVLAQAALWAAPLAAQETAAFLKIGVGARPIAMGGAYTAIADDVNAIAWNPAGLGVLQKRELGFMHAELFADTRYDFMGYAHPTKMGTLGLGLNYLSQASLEGRDSQGRPTGSFTASDKALTLGYGRGFTDSMRLGLGLKFIQSDIAEASARGFALDLGTLYNTRHLSRFDLPITVGMSIQNLGPGMTFLDRTSPLPLTLAAGLGYQLPLGLTLAMDFKHRPYADKNEFSVGTEYAVLPAAALRLGYASNVVAVGKNGSGIGNLGGLSGLGAGFGLRIRGYSVDYAFTPFGELGNVQRFSLGARF